MVAQERVSCLRLAALLVSATALFGQPSPQAPPQAAPSQAAPAAAETGKVSLDVVVNQKSGPPIADLQQQDFTVLDNNAPQTITSFRAYTGREAPIEMILVLDAVNIGAERLAFTRNQISKFLRAESGHLSYPLAVTLFTEKGLSIVGNFSTDGNTLAAALDKEDVGPRAIGRSAGFYGATDRWQMSVNALRQLIIGESARPRRKIVLWVSPGWPLLSGPETDMMGAKEQQHIFDTIVMTSTQLRQARITLYCVNPLGSDESLSNDTYYQNFLKPVTKPNQVYLGNLGLQVLAVQSGGLTLNLNNDTAALLQQCVADSAPYYEISFTAPPAAKKDEYHRLEIKLGKPGLTARTSQGYYSQPPA